VRWITCNAEEYLISGSADKCVRVWKDGQEWVLKGHQANVVAISAICVGQTSSRFASASTDGKVLVWRLDAGGFGLEQTISTGRKCALALAMGTLPKTDGTHEMIV